MTSHDRHDKTRTANSDELSLSGSGPDSFPADVPVPKTIGRYRIRRVLGQGGFGLVYLADDERLGRHVAVKVPHARLVTQLQDAESYLKEARTVANLDHPNIVPVYDVGSNEQFPCYIVSKFIDGSDLATMLKHQRLDFLRAARIIAQVAEAQHHAHKQGLVHRDVKPSNILIDREGTPFLVDFGLALREGDTGAQRRYAGTPSYMSPEQARGEGHRVDGRSDIFSLGVVFYELLVGRRPFRGDSREALLEQVTSYDPKPPRQYDEKLPKELERICNKAMAKRASDRYSSAFDFAEDLRHFLDEQSQPHTDSSSQAFSNLAVADTRQFDSGTTPGPMGTVSHSSNIRVIPKGLRSFDSNDSDFFLELLPGPRDREGLPDSLRFWKTQIEILDSDNTFSVGVLYGPSGCGKSSLVKAGLLPRLSDEVISVYVEAAPNETESRLLKGLRKRCPDLDENWNLKQALEAIRQGRGLSHGRKVLIVIDQFEQWLHAKKEDHHTELVQALRQCDGGRVQCIVMVRDDFWMALTRFLKALEIGLVEGSNFAVVDLFPIRHACKVLAAFGRAYQALPEAAEHITDSQQEFIRQSVDGLAEDGKVIPVRLALFAEMMKGKSWEPATLKAVGGTEGVGVNYLDKSFSDHSNPKYRVHEKAVRAVLTALLPESGMNIKGNMKSQTELLDASGYAANPGEFEDLIQILDHEMRLITPTDPGGMDPSDEPTEKYFQLAHDYLVPSLRSWLTRKQQETRRGRAELLLAERSVVWNAHPENRFLPSGWEYPGLRLLTDSANWTPPQRRMMRQAGRHHLVRVSLAGMLVVVLVLAGIAISYRVDQLRKSDVAQALVTRLMDAEISQVPGIIEEIDQYRRWADQRLQNQLLTSPEDASQKLRLSLALLPVDPQQLSFLSMALNDANPSELPVIRDAMHAHRVQLMDSLWQRLEDASQPPQFRFNAAVVLAGYDPNNTRWAGQLPFVSHQLVETLTRNPRDFALLLQSVEAIRSPLAEQVSMIVRDPEQGELRRETALNVVLDFSADNVSQLAELLAYSEQQQFERVFSSLSDYSDQSVDRLTNILEESWADDASETEKERVARRQSNVMVALMRLNRPDKVWPRLKSSSDPRSRSYFIHWAPSLGVDPQPILHRLSEETDPSILRSLLLMMGEFDNDRMPQGTRATVLPKIVALHENHPDPGVHGSAEWLLRIWEDEVRQSTGSDDPDVNETALLHAGHLKTIQQFIQQQQKLTDVSDWSFDDAGRKWIVNSQGQTFALLEAGTIWMGSPESEPYRTIDREQHHARRIARKLAISMYEVTREQYRRFQEENEATIQILRTEQYAETEDSPQLAVSWYAAAHYCNWLSEKEGIPESQWCYQANVDGSYADGMKLKPDYLELDGFRLPTEAEWEFACRAGTTTSRYYGLSDSMIDQYACYRSDGNQTLPVGRLKPNDFGMFDMLGNAMEWCNGPEITYPGEDHVGPPLADQFRLGKVRDADPRVLRGGAFLSQISLIRCADRVFYGPANRYYTLGFRPVRVLK